ncbi:MAG: O-antigen ligase family protein [Lewinellaceae bacterium]|nr:O-antigen ligase family protein [Lewinellaceae bacterium]
MLNHTATSSGRHSLQHPQRWFVWGVAAASLLCILAAVAFDAWWVAGVPAVLLVLWLAVVDFRKVFFLMLACIPISIEMELPGGFGTDLPSEPLMWLLTLVAVAWFLRHWRTVDGRFLKHPITLALLLHLAWTTVAVVGSTDFLVSFKFLLAKGWYVVVFYFLAAYILRVERDYKNLLWWFFVPLVVTVAIILVRHAPHGFSFKEVNYVMGPFYRNHVMYACLLAIFLPFVWYGTYWYRRYSGAWWFLVLGIGLLILGINFAYTRAAYVALLAAVGIYWLVRRRLIKVALLVFFIGFAGFVLAVTKGDNWLEFAPNYERAVSHTSFDNLLEATTKLEDISIMERVYRWVAAAYMIRDRPYTGFGPGNFYFNYKNYAVSSFKTYVSDNPERSGIHNYYLMVTVEQGIPGLLFFLAFCFTVIFMGQQIYHRTPDPARRRILVSALLSFMLIALLMLMNDFVETDKIGSLFFLCAAVLVNADLETKQKKRALRD